MTILGLDEQGNKVEITQTHRYSSMYILGKTGVGKSTLISNMMEQDIFQGIGCCLIEPHHDLTESVIRRCDMNRINRDDVILLNPLDSHPFGLNIYECPDITDPIMVGYTLNSVMDTFEKLYDMSRNTPQMAQTFRNLTLLLIHNPGMTILEIPQILTEKPFRTRLLANLPERYHSFWKRYETLSPNAHEELTKSTINKVNEFINDPIGYYIYGQSHTSINFREMMDKNKIVLISLASNFPLLTSLLGSILISQILMSALSRENIPEKARKPFNLYVDEFQNFATPSMNQLLTESRKYHVGSTIGHQTRGQLPETLLSTTLNAGSFICFQVTSEDAEALAPEFLVNPETTQTVPRNCLDYYIDRHKNEVVKHFSGDYIHKLKTASKMRVHETSDSYQRPSLNFGEGEQKFVPEDIDKILRITEDLFYVTMSTKNIDRNRYYLLLILMSRLLKFEGYVPWCRATIQGEKDKAVLDALCQPIPDEEEPRFNRFENRLYEVCTILLKEPILVNATGNGAEYTASSFSDREHEIANELVHLKKGHARVKIPNGEYLMTTIIPESKNADLQQKKDRIIENTRRRYCCSRAEVEAEIRRRHGGGEPSPTITRKHQV